jgi:hypothetical protein
MISSKKAPPLALVADFLVLALVVAGTIAFLTPDLAIRPPTRLTISVQRFFPKNAPPG